MRGRNWPKTLLLGAGDIGARVLANLAPRGAVTAVTSTPANLPALKRKGALALRADLDRPGSLARLPRDWQWLLHFAPPPGRGLRDTRTRNLLRAPALRVDARKNKSLARVIVYLSTSGVYGDCRGERVSEKRPPSPANARARRRVDAETVLSRAAKRRRMRLVVLRVPGIYAANRLPLERLRQGTPAICVAEDSYTNHIHADDLAAIAVHALRRTARRALQPVRVFNCSDDSDMKMGDWFDLVARAFGMAPPPRLPRAQVERAVSPLLMSFMGESRRLDNARLKRELRARLQFPTVAAGLAGVRR